MADQNLVARLSVEASQFIAGMNQGEAAVTKFAGTAATSLARIGSSVAPATKSVEGLNLSLHGLEKGQRAAKTAGMILGGAFSSITGEAGTAASAIGRLGAAAALGGWIGAAVAGVHLLADAYKDLGKEAEEAARQQELAIRRAEDRAATAALELRSAEAGRKPQQQADVERANQLVGQQLRLQQEIAEIQDRLATNRDDPQQRFEDTKRLAEAQRELNAAMREAAALAQTIRDEGATTGRAGIEKTLADAKKVQAENEEARRKAYLTRVDLAAEAIVSTITASEASKAELDKAAEEGKKVAAEIRKERIELERRLSESDTVERFTAEFELPRTEEGKNAALGASAAYKEAQEIAKSQVDLAKAVQNGWEVAGSAMANAFSGLGDAIGGAGGTVLKVLGQILAGAVAVAIAMSMAVPPPFNIIAAAAAGAAMIATIASTISQAKSAVGREFGGPVIRGKAYLVGERGPELFRPNSSGDIIPNRAFATAGGPTINLNITAMDGKSVYRVLTDAQGEVVRFLRETVRDGRW